MRQRVHAIASLLLLAAACGAVLLGTLYPALMQGTGAAQTLDQELMQLSGTSVAGSRTWSEASSDGAHASSENHAGAFVVVATADPFAPSNCAHNASIRADSANCFC